MKFILLLSFLLVACQEKKENLVKELRLALSSEVSTLDPAGCYDTVCAPVVANSYETLFEYEYLKRPYQLRPLLAEEMPVFGTIASQFNDPGTNQLYAHIISLINEKSAIPFKSHLVESIGKSEKIYIIPPARVRYLSEIAENNRKYDAWVLQQSIIASRMYALDKVMQEDIQDKSPIVALSEKLHQDIDGLSDYLRKKY